jgi:hypothetical protein
MHPRGAAEFAFSQSIGRAVDIGERPLCGAPVISHSRPRAVVRLVPIGFTLFVRSLVRSFI